MPDAVLFANDHDGNLAHVCVHDAIWVGDFDKADALARLLKAELRRPGLRGFMLFVRDGFTSRAIRDMRNVIEHRLSEPIGCGGPRTVLTDLAATRAPDLPGAKPEEKPGGGVQYGFPNPSEPMTKQKAADAWGTNMTAHKLTTLMKRGKVRHCEFSRQSWVFCCDDVPNLRPAFRTG